MFNKSLFFQKSEHNVRRFNSTLRWLLVSVLIGIVVGLISGSFGDLLQAVTAFRLSHAYLLFGLPFGAMAIVAMYHLILHEKDPGTNLVISAIHSDDRIPLRMAPLIYISTILTHLVGGSAGREGAALQLGGSIGNAFGEYLGFREKEDRNIMRHECCLFCSFRNADRSRCLFHGSRQCRNHALCCPASLRDLLAHCARHCPVCLWHCITVL